MDGLYEMPGNYESKHSQLSDDSDDMSEDPLPVKEIGDFNGMSDDENIEHEVAWCVDVGVGAAGGSKSGRMKY